MIKFFLKFFNKKPTADSLEQQIGYVFKNKKLKNQALTHKSFNPLVHNERLEFLGDAVFDLCVSLLIMEQYPKANEGDLSKMRSSLVNTSYLAELALSLSLHKRLRLGLSEKKDKGKFKPRLLACVMEAVTGAVYLDGGYSSAYTLVKKLMQGPIQEGLVHKDYKSILQEFVQKKFQKVPQYNIVKSSGPEHHKIFIMEVSLEKKILGQGKGKSKKEAAQSAAESALKKLKVKYLNHIKKEAFS